MRFTAFFAFLTDTKCRECRFRKCRSVGEPEKVSVSATELQEGDPRHRAAPSGTLKRLVDTYREITDKYIVPEILLSIHFGVTFLT